MMKFIKTKGIVIRQNPTGDADKVVTFLTPDYGKIHVIAPGAKRTRSRLGGCTEFLCYSDIDIFKTKDTYQLRDGKIIASFYEIRNDLINFSIASFFSEVLQDIVMEGIKAPSEIKLFLNSLYYLSKEKKDKELIMAVFIMKLLAMNGLAPMVSECVSCHTRFINDALQNLFFSFSKCGILCNQCVKDPSDMKVSRGMYYLLNHIQVSSLSNLFQFHITKDILREITILSDRFLKERLEKKF